MNFIQSTKSIILSLKNKIDRSTDRCMTVASTFAAIDDYLEQEPDVWGDVETTVTDAEKQIIQDAIDDLIEADDPLSGRQLNDNLFTTTQRLVDKVQGVTNDYNHEHYVFINGVPIVTLNDETGNLTISTEYNSNGVKGHTADLAADLVAGADLNVVVSTALELAANMKMKSVLSYVDAQQAYVYYKTMVEDRVANLQGDALTYSQIIGDNIKNGPVGILGALKQLYKSSERMHSTSSGWEWTDNSQYSVVSNLFGAIQALAVTIADVVMEILAWIGNVVGALAYGIYMLGKGIISLVSQGVDRAVYATILDNEPEFYSFSPALFQFSVDDQSTMANTLHHDFPEIKLWGSIYLNTPWGPTIMYYDTDAKRIYIEMHASAALDLVGVQTSLQYFTHPIEYSWTPGGAPGPITWHDFEFEYTENSSTNSFKLFWELSLQATASGHKTYSLCPDDASDSETDKYLCKSYNAAIGLFLGLCWLSTAKRKDNHKYTVTANGVYDGVASQPAKVLNCIFANTYYLTDLMQQNQNWVQPYLPVDNKVDWKYLLNADKAQSYVLQWILNFPFSYDFNLAWVFSDLRAGLESVSPSEENDYPEFVNNFNGLGDAYVSTPLIDRTMAIAAMVSAAVALAITASIAVVGAIRIKRHRNVKRANLKVTAEQKWDAYKANPTEANYFAYRKAARRNNRFVRRFGGTSLATSGYWDSTDSTSSVAASETLTTLGNVWENPTVAKILSRENDVDDMTGLTSLIKMVGNTGD